MRGRIGEGVQFGGRAYVWEDLVRIADLGMHFAEINLLQGEGLIKRTPDLLDLARKRGLSYVVHAPNEGDPLDVRRLEGEFSREILGLVEACGALHCRILTLHFWVDARFIPGGILERKRSILYGLAREAWRKGVFLCLENLSERPEDLGPLMETCPELSITLDIGHGELFARRNRALDILDRWPERVRHVHVHDNRGGSRVEDDLHLPIGEGTIDFPSIFREMIRVGYDGTVTLEVPHDRLKDSLTRLKDMILEE